MSQNEDHTGPCTCGFELPDIVVHASRVPAQIIMTCPKCGERWEIVLRCDEPDGDPGDMLS